MKNVGQLIRAADGALIVEQLHIADRFWSRLAGLQFRRPLPAGAALLIVPCSSIHTAFLRFPLDAAFLDAAGRVVEIRRDVQPWRIAAPHVSAHAVLETTAGQMPPLTDGDVLKLMPASPAAARSSLRFLV